MNNKFLLYGSYGYTGALIAERALDLGLEPILAGRNAAKVSMQAGELDLPYHAVELDDDAALDRVLQETPLVLHCAGPFAHTSKAMADACLRTGRHYLDVTGEISVFEALAARDAEAKAKNVMLLPGVGFDVVPSDCLAAHLKRRMPDAIKLTLAFVALGKASRGTATTAVENIKTGGAARENGKIVYHPAGHHTKQINFGDKTRTAVTVAWGDVSTAFYSTGIPNIEVYAAFPKSMQSFVKWSGVLSPILGSSPVQSFLKKRIRNGEVGPSAEERAGGKSVLYGEVEDASGRRAVSRLIGPEGYDLTARAALLIVQKMLGGQIKPGFQTPSLAFGPDLVLEVEGVSRTDG